MSIYTEPAVQACIIERIKKLKTDGVTQTALISGIVDVLGNKFPDDAETADAKIPSNSDFSNWVNQTKKMPARKMRDKEVLEALCTFILQNHDPEGIFAKRLESSKNEAQRVPTPQRRARPAKPKPQDLRSKAALSPVAPGQYPTSGVETLPQSFAQTLLGSLQTFEGVCNTYLVFPRFSPQALSVHMTFSAFYAFLGLAASWGFFEISGFGDVELLPARDTEVAADDSRATINIPSTLSNRFFILSALVAVVMIFAIGALIATTKLGRDLTQKTLGVLRGNEVAFAATVSVISAVALYLSGMAAPFCELFAVMMTLSIILAGRAHWKTLIWAIYPVSFFINIFLIGVLAAYFGTMSAAGGVLPILSLLCLVMGALTREGNATIAAGIVTLSASLILAGLNYVSFDGIWFLVEPWDPGTFLVFLVIPIANGIWDWISMSITRQLTSTAIKNTEGADHGVDDAVRLYIAFVLIDLLIAFLTILCLYVTLFYGFELYNLISGRNASLNDYFRGFQQGLTTDYALLVIIMLVTVLMPTMLHVHLVGRAWIQKTGWQALLPTLAYVGSMLLAIALLLTIARGVLKLLYPIPA